MMVKYFVLVSCMLVLVNAGTYGRQRVNLKDADREYSANGNPQTNKAPAVPSPTKFGFVPKRTPASYAATQPKPQYLQHSYKVKELTSKTESQYDQPQNTYQYTSDNVRYTSSLPESSSDNAQYSNGVQQYLTQQQAQEYAFAQPEAQEQVQYQQPESKYEQYDNVQYVSDNDLSQADGAQEQQYNSQTAQPQYYLVQPHQSSSSAAESLTDSKAFEYINYIPTYDPNTISIDQKISAPYVVPKLPSVTTTVTKKYTSTVSNKAGKSSSKQGGQKAIQYVIAPTKEYNNNNKQEEILYKREPKSLLDSYVPSVLQLQYLKQQGKDSFSGY